MKFPAGIKFRYANLLLFVIVTAAVVSLLLSKAKEGKCIRTAELRRENIMGPLEKSVGTLVNIEAVVIGDNEKGDIDTLKVISVDGIKLATPVNIEYRIHTLFPKAVSPTSKLKLAKLMTADDFSPWQESPFSKGGQYSLRGYQHLEMNGDPDEVWVENTGQVSQSRGYWLNTIFVVTNWAK